MTSPTKAGADRSEELPGGRHLRALDVDECLERLGRHYLGRLAFLDGETLKILPLNYVLHEGSVVMRVGIGSSLDAIDNAPVAFEVDDISLEDHSGWSVVVNGRAEEVWRPEELEALRTLPLRPWAPGPRDHFIRIASTAITGRDLG
jgi:uncharacterized protein